MKIKKIEKSGSQPVYNMYVSNKNCFLTTKSNICVSNCDSLRYGVLFFEDKSLKYNKTATMGW